MISFKISVEEKEELDASQLRLSIAELIENIDNQPGVLIVNNRIPKQGSRGSSYDISSIIIKAIELGVFAGIYTAIMEFYDRFKNAEVTLKFENGNSIVIKGISKKEALDLIEKYSREKDNQDD